MSEYRFADFLAESFAALRREVPDIYREMCRRLAGRGVGIRVDGEPVTLRFAANHARFDDRPGPVSIAVDTDRRTILALIDAEQTLVDAVLGDALLLRGDTDALLVFHDGLMAYIHGAVRAPSVAWLLERFRSEGAGLHPKRSQSAGLAATEDSP